MVLKQDQKNKSYSESIVKKHTNRTSLSCRTQQVICLALISPIVVMAGQETELEIEERKKYRNSVVVSSTKTKRKIDDVPNEVTVVTREDIDQKNAQGLKELFAHEIDLTVREMPKRYGMSGQATGRAGSEGINIRGLEGNQVLMVQDGIRLPNSFQYGPFSTGRGDFLNLTNIKKIEVLRGPASTLYGSDGLAGVMSIETISPKDLLNGDQTSNAYLETKYSTLNKGFNGDAGFAFQQGSVQGLVLLNQAYKHEVINQGMSGQTGSLRTKPNPLNERSQGILAKAYYNINDQHQLGMTYEGKNQYQESKVLSAIDETMIPIRRGWIQINTLGFQTQDKLNRDLWSLSHEYINQNSTSIKKSNTKVYFQDANVEQSSQEDRLINGSSQYRTRVNQYRQNLVGLNTQFESHWHGLADHRLIYGLDISEAKVSAVRNGTFPNNSERFPHQPFPKTSHQMLGAYIQDEIDVGSITVIPGLRFDQYKLTPMESQEAASSKKSGGSTFTPRLGGVWRAHSLFSPYVQYATAYRAPTPDQVNHTFENRQHGYVSVGNENLLPEKAKSLEWGFRGKHQGFKYSGSIYVNRYDDFISQEKISGLGSSMSPSVYQYVNLTKAKIQGWDMRADWQVNKNWRLLSGVAASQGSSEKNNVVTPMNSVEPMKWVAGIQFDDQQWGAQVFLRHHAQKKSNQVSAIRLTPNEMANQYIPPSFNVVDVGIQYRPHKKITIRANINNLLNKKYWNWSDVRGLPAQSKVLDAYTAPGRNFNLSLRMDY